MPRDDGGRAADGSTLTIPGSGISVTCDPLSNLLYTQENILNYRPGGYHPVSLGDTFKGGRYRVKHTLGWGGFSTVWLARDVLLYQWVALKIVTADSSRSSREPTALRALQRKNASDYVPLVLDSFRHAGPNGSHRCLVFELLGPSIDTVIGHYQADGDRLDPEDIIRISSHLLQAVALAHKAGFGHGDVSGGNVVFTAKMLANVSEDELFDIIGVPTSVKLQCADGGHLCSDYPKEIVEKASWNGWADDDEEDIRLLDWGEAFTHGAEPKEIAQPGDLRAPETIFASQFDHRIDLWRTGCLIYSLIFLAHPFMYLGDATLIAQMINFVEQLPTHWRESARPFETARSSHMKSSTLRNPN